MTDKSPSTSAWPTDLDPEKLDQIVSIIAKEGSVEKAAVLPHATLESLEIASIDVVSILMAVEEEMGIYVPIDNNMASAQNLSEFISTIVASEGREASDGVSEGA